MSVFALNPSGTLKPVNISPFLNGICISAPASFTYVLYSSGPCVNSSPPNNPVYVAFLVVSIGDLYLKPPIGAAVAVGIVGAT